MNWSFGKDCDCGQLCSWIRGLWKIDSSVPDDSVILVQSEAKGCGRVALTDLLVSKQVYVGTYAARSANGATQSFSRDATITRTAQGRWRVVFAADHPDGVDYHPSLSVEEQADNRDGVDIQIVQGSQTENGFEVMLTTGDNGGSADTYVDAPWSFEVTAPVTVVTGFNMEAL